MMVSFACRTSQMSKRQHTLRLSCEGEAAWQDALGKGLLTVRSPTPVYHQQLQHHLEDQQLPALAQACRYASDSLSSNEGR